MRNRNAFFRSGWRGAAVVALAAILAGCDSKPALPPVTGVVTYGGQPLAGANVLFTPEKGIASGATTGPDGRFELQANDGRKGAEVGKHRVSVVRPSPEVPPPMGGESGPPPLPEPPLEHHVELEVTAEGENNFTIDIPMQ